MVDPTTPNISLAIPAHLSDVGAWDTPMNNNYSLIDLIVGGSTTIGLTNANVVLSAAQYQQRLIQFTGTLTGSVTITFPSTFTKDYEVYHTCNGSSAFTITLATTAAGGEQICAPPGEIVDVVNDGTNLRYKNLGRVGTYWDYCGSSVPNWVSGCTKAPYLNCDGTTFSSATFPQLAMILGSTTLPDSKGRVRTALDQSAGRISSGTGGFTSSGPLSNTGVGASGGAQTNTLGSSNLPANIPYNDPGHFHTLSAQTGAVYNYYAGGFQGYINQSINTDTKVTNITINPGSANTAITNLQPSYIGGLTLIRAG